jgi:hypothetical protein
VLIELHTSLEITLLLNLMLMLMLILMLMLNLMLISRAAQAAHVYGGRCGGDLSPRRVGSGIKTGKARFYGAREGAALPLK